jgi:heme exporter protein D
MMEFLAMGGYARFVWPAYGVALLVLAGMAVISLRAWRRQRRLWSALETARTHRRSPSP